MRYRRLIVVVALMALIVPAAAFAFQGSGGKGGGKSGGSGSLGMPRGAWWQRSDVVKELSLSGKQQESIEKITLAHRKEMIKLRADLDLAELDLDPLLSAKKLDEGAIKGAIAKVEAVRAKISKNRMDMLLQIRKVLTRDQYIKLKQYKGQRGRSGNKRANKGPVGQRGMCGAGNLQKGNG